MKVDGKILLFSSPIHFKDMLGKVYYLLPCLSSVGTTSPADLSSIADKQKANGVRRIKIVITKKQLQEQLTKQASVEDFLLGLEKKTCNNAFDSRTNGKPKLESISEGSE